MIAALGCLRDPCTVAVTRPELRHVQLRQHVLSRTDGR